MPAISQVMGIASNRVLFLVWLVWFTLTLPWQLLSAQRQVMHAINLDGDD